MIKVYSASWCSPCKALKEMLKGNNVEYEEVDIEKDPEICRSLGIRGVPTIINTANDKRLVGAVTFEQLEVILC